MLNWMDEMYISTKLKMSRLAEEIRNDESGVSGFVVTVLLILFAVLAGGLLWNWLGGEGGYLSKLFEKITTNSNFTKTNISPSDF